MDSLRGINISDLHIPFADPLAIRLLIKIVKVWQPDFLIYDGDALDFYSVSTHDKNPDRLKNSGLQNEIDQWTDIATEINNAAGAECVKTFVPGNHEDRLRRYLWRDSALHGLEALAIPNLLRLDALGIGYEEHEVSLANGNLIVKHGERVRAKAGASAMAELEKAKFSYSGISGHTHRMGSTMTRTRHGVVGWWENGCLCDLNPEYVNEPDWQHGVSLIWHTPGQDAFTVQSLPFLDGKCLLEGKRVSV
jgi:predicted phosphodiesterase